MAFGDNLPQAIKDITEQNKVGQVLVRKTQAGNYSQSQGQSFLVRGRGQPIGRPRRSPYYRQLQRGSKF